MPKQWDDTTDRQLLLIIMSLTMTALPKWDKVAELMGEGYTASGVRQHYQKLRKIPMPTPSATTSESVKNTGGKISREDTIKPACPKKTAQSEHIMAKPEGSGDAGDEEDEQTPKKKKIKLEAAESSEDEL